MAKWHDPAFRYTLLVASNISNVNPCFYNRRPQVSNRFEEGKERAGEEEERGAGKSFFAYVNHLNVV
jgi:hypothetical protein